MVNDSRPSPVHPLLLALLPLLLILQQNLLEIEPSQILRAVFVSLLLSVLVWSLVYLQSRDLNFSALIASLTVLLFHTMGRFYSGNVHGVIRGANANVGLLGNPGLTLGVTCVVFGLGLFALRGLRRYRDGITVLLNVLGLSLTTVVLGTIAVRERALRQPLQVGLAETTVSLAPTPGSSPDIYVIVLDGYGREDVLRQLYDYDNSPFLQSLEGLGFQIIPDARANYMQTSLSLASALNLDYLQNLLPDSQRAEHDREALIRLIHHSVLGRMLREHGYTDRAVDSGYRPTNLKGASEYFGPDSRATNLFERLVIENSGVALVGGHPSSPEPFSHPGYRLHRDRIRFALQYLSRPAADTGAPRWTFVHILAPHPPFVFDAHGDPVQPDYPYVLLDGSAYPGEMRDYRHQYIQQLRYVNRNLLASLISLVDEKGHEAAIVIQADHGPGTQLNWDSYDATNHRERLGILLAYRAPDGAGSLPGEVLSPVNLYRALINRSLGTELPLVENRSYFSTWDRLYDFEQVPDSLLSGEDGE